MDFIWSLFVFSVFLLAGLGRLRRLHRSFVAYGPGVPFFGGAAGSVVMRGSGGGRPYKSRGVRLANAVGHFLLLLVSRYFLEAGFTFGFRLGSGLVQALLAGIRIGFKLRLACGCSGWVQIGLTSDFWHLGVAI